MRPIALAAALAALLLVPATSVAGGFATVGLSSLPDDTRPGEAWVVDMTVLQHGQTPLEDVRPAVVIEPAGPGKATRSGRGKAIRFDARPTGEPGVYRARVVFPSAGEWRYLADDGFTQVHELGTVSIGNGPAAAAEPAAAAKAAAAKPAAASAPPAAGGGGVSLLGALGIAALAGLLAALAVPIVGRRLSSRAAGT